MQDPLLLKLLKCRKLPNCQWQYLAIWQFGNIPKDRDVRSVSAVGAKSGYKMKVFAVECKNLRFFKVFAVECKNFCIFAL